MIRTKHAAMAVLLCAATLIGSTGCFSKTREDPGLTACKYLAGHGGTTSQKQLTDLETGFAQSKNADLARTGVQWALVAKQESGTFKRMAQDALVADACNSAGVKLTS